MSSLAKLRRLARRLGRCLPPADGRCTCEPPAWAVVEEGDPEPPPCPACGGRVNVLLTVFDPDFFGNARLQPGRPGDG
jgi:hypothetical protein